MLGSDGVALALSVVIFACGMALLSHRFYAVYRGWPLRRIRHAAHFPGALGTALMLFATLLGFSVSLLHGLATVLVGSALSYLYVYLLRLRPEAALLGPVLAGLALL